MPMSITGAPALATMLLRGMAFLRSMVDGPMLEGSIESGQSGISTAAIGSLVGYNVSTGASGSRVTPGSGIFSTAWRTASMASTRLNDLRHASTTRRSGGGGLKGMYSSSESRLTFSGTDVIGNTVTPRPEPTM